MLSMCENEKKNSSYCTGTLSWDMRDFLQIKGHTKVTSKQETYTSPKSNWTRSAFYGVPIKCETK